MINIQLTDRQLSILLFSVYRFNQDAWSQFNFYCTNNYKLQDLSDQQAKERADKFFKDIQDGEQLYKMLNDSRHNINVESNN